MKKLASLSIAVLILTFPLQGSTAELTVHEGEKIMDVVRAAKAGDTILVMPGTYRETVYIDKNGLTLRGEKAGGTWPVLDGESKLNDGIIVAGHDVSIERLHIRRYKGNGIMLQGANNFRVQGNQIEGPSFYGVFPQYTKNGLIANNVVWRVEDAAIYVGMSENLDVLYNETFGSVMGIEAENSSEILFEGNYVHDNSAGITVTLVPGLPIKTAKKTIIRNNTIVDNNHENFALPGAIAAGVPKGLGIMIFAADDIVIENNVIRGNQNAAFFIADHNFIPVSKDPLMDPRPDKIVILDNVVIDNGTDPSGQIKAMLQTWAGGNAPDLLTTGKGRKNCIAPSAGLSTFGADRWRPCTKGRTSTNITSYQTPEPVEAVDYSPEQVGRLTYMATCSGCHAFKSRLVGPPMIGIKALYQGREGELARWISAPTRKRSDYPEMPPQDYLPAATREAVAHFIVNELSN